MLRVKVGEHLDNALGKIKTKSPGLQAVDVKNLFLKKTIIVNNYEVVRVLNFLCTSIRLNYV